MNKKLKMKTILEYSKKDCLEELLKQYEEHAKQLNNIGLTADSLIYTQVNYDRVINSCCNDFDFLLKNYLKKDRILINDNIYNKEAYDKITDSFAYELDYILLNPQIHPWIKIVKQNDFNMEDSIAAYSENKILYDIIKGFLNEQYEIDIEQFGRITAHKDALESILYSAVDTYTSGNKHNVIDLESVLKKRKRHKYYFNK
jgi:hypothetical protein